MLKEDLKVGDLIYMVSSQGSGATWLMEVIDLLPNDPYDIQVYFVINTYAPTYTGRLDDVAMYTINLHHTKIL